MPLKKVDSLAQPRREAGSCHGNSQAWLAEAVCRLHLLVSMIVGDYNETTCGAIAGLKPQQRTCQTSS